MILFDPYTPTDWDLLDTADTVGYILPHGGTEFHVAATRLTPAELPRLERCVRFLPALNGRTLAAVQAGLARWPECAHWLFCETAFFADLPPVAAAYALPYDYFTAGYRRYGGDGLCHSWVAQQVRAPRVVSIHLGDRSSVAALQAGHPVATSLGFTPVAGLPSATGCGDLDPAIPLLLCEAGLEPAAVERALAEESGFTALLGRPAGLADVLREPGLARDLWRHALLKAVGAALATLGGADVLVCACDDLPALRDCVTDLQQSLAFVNVAWQVLAYDRRAVLQEFIC